VELRRGHTPKQELFWPQVWTNTANNSMSGRKVYVWGGEGEVLNREGRGEGLPEKKTKIFTYLYGGEKAGCII